MKTFSIVLFSFCISLTATAEETPKDQQTETGRAFDLPTLIEPTELSVPEAISVPVEPYALQVLPVQEILPGDPEYKSPRKAFRLSLGLTSASVLASAFGVGVVGLGIAPSAGHIYAGEKRHARVMSTARFASLFAATAGFTLCFLGGAQAALTDGAQGQELAVSGFRIGVGASALYVLLAAYDIIDAPYAAKRHNQKRKQIQ